jgi:hypothetical protein
MPVLGAGVRTVAGDISLARSNGTSIDDPDFTFGVDPSGETVLGAAKLCVLVTYREEAADADAVSAVNDKFNECVRVISRILTRAEQLRKRRPPTAAAAQARRCSVSTVRLRGSRARRAPLRVACRRTAAGVRVTLGTRNRRTLRSVLGTSAKLIVGRTRAAAARPGDRVNVLWRTP